MTKVKYKIFSSALFSTSLKVLTFLRKAELQRKEIKYCTPLGGPLILKDFPQVFFQTAGRTYVSDIYHCYIHYFSLLSKEHRNLIFNGTVIDLLLTIFSLFFCVQRIQRILETQTKYNLKYTSIDNAMLQELPFSPGNTTI